MVTTPLSSSDAQLNKIETFFGPIYVEESHRMVLPEGLIGFEEFTDFYLAPLLHNGYKEPFHVLYNLEEPQVSFLLLPVCPWSIFFKPDDIEEGCSTHNIAESNLQVYSITTLFKKKGIIHPSLNLKAPLLVDTHRQKAWQYIFKGKDYPLRFFIS